MSYTMMWRYLFAFALFGWGCSSMNEKEQLTQEKNTLFRRLSSQSTGIIFSNDINTKQDFDVFRYRNFYNGGGVGIGDFNNDGLSDIFLTANMSENRLFLNKGGWKFEDITKTAGVGGTKVWSTGVSIADVNADGF